MKFSTDRILTTHAGALPQADDLKRCTMQRSSGHPIDEAGFCQAGP